MKITGWMFTDAILNCQCSRCGASIGKSCRTPKGRKTNMPHSERVDAVRVMAGDARDDYWSRPIKLRPDDELVIEAKID